ncbi:MAG: biopolymer transporter ExbD [bacterium]|nr:biopolymer transporter ExbD [bacterium]
MNKKYVHIALACFGLLILFSCNSDEKKIVKRPAPSIPSQQTEVLRNDANAIQIRLNNTNKVMIEGTIVDSVQLKSQLRLAKRQKGDTATVVLHVKGDTDFGMFAAVHRTLDELLLEDRDSIAQLRFKTFYDNLEGSQQAIIRRKYHLRIIEKMTR